MHRPRHRHPDGDPAHTPEHTAPVQPVNIDAVILHKQICHEAAVEALHDAKNGGIVSVISDQLPSLDSVDPETKKEVKSIATDIAKETSETLKDALKTVE